MRTFTVKGYQFVCKDIKLMTLLILGGYELLGFAENFRDHNKLVWYFRMSLELKAFVEDYFGCEIIWESDQAN